MAFVVTNIIDGNTFQVSNWKLGENWAGTKVRILGYRLDASNTAYHALALGRLRSLLISKEVDLRAPASVIQENGENILVCPVFLNNVDVSSYFPELRQRQPS